MSTALCLIFAGVLSRLAPHPPNMVALGAIALYAGARLPRKWALVVPLAVLAFSDLALDSARGHAFNPGVRLGGYAVFSLLAFAGGLLPRNASPLTRAAAAVAGSTLFFAVSNFEVWASSGGFGYPRTTAGLWSTYVVALPYYANSLIADLAGTAALFGLDALAARLRHAEASPESAS